MTKDSPIAASLARRSICSAFRRCMSRVSDIEREKRLSRDYKMPEFSSRIHNPIRHMFQKQVITWIMEETG